MKILIIPLLLGISVGVNIYQYKTFNKRLTQGIEQTEINFKAKVIETINQEARVEL